MVGKWHLGFYEWSYTPTYRGFDSFYGFYTGSEDHYNHKKMGVLDLRDNKKPVKDKGGFYSAELFAKQAERVIMSHNVSEPLFLYLPFQNVHGPVQAPDNYVKKYDFIKDTTRRHYAAMVDIVDEAIGNVTQAMKQAGLWENTLMIFTTDNGGIPTYGGYDWPLRGHKDTVWEGGMRGVGFVHGTMLRKTGVKCSELLHVTDWYPTLLNLTGIPDVTDQLPPLDGFNIWDTISQGSPSPRTEILHNIDLPTNSLNREVHNGIAIRVGDMKLLMNVPNKTWYKPPELSYGNGYFEKLGNDAVLVKVALYNITADPDERVDLSTRLPDMLKKLQDRVQYYMKGMVPSGKKPHDPEALKLARENGYWGPWRS